LLRTRDDNVVHQLDEWVLGPHERSRATLTRTLLTTPRLRARARQLVAGAVVVATVGLALPGAGADASARTESATIAAEADRAVAALDRWSATHNPADYVRFVQSREIAAVLTATDLEVDPAGLRDAWAATPIEKQHAVLAALSQLGVPYRSLKSDPDVGFDCSGLTSWAFAQAGIELPRVSRDQIRAVETVEQADAEPGDLAWYPGHVSIYLGLGTMVHSPNSGNRVEAVALSSKTREFGDTLTVDTAAD
jgi:cell wall-associated NlpC family hydrolase